ncbi:hypothetical protein BH24ACT3_BH24ACT3_12500 [soil metagenome]
MPAKLQISVRVPADLRRAVKQRAVDEGTTVQSFVEQALRSAVAKPERSADPGVRRLVRNLIDSGAYAEEVRRIGEEDPDLATM